MNQRNEYEKEDSHFEKQKREKLHQQRAKLTRASFQTKQNSAKIGTANKIAKSNKS